MGEVSLRPLALDDLQMLHLWFNEPHLRPFYMQEDTSLNEVQQKFTPRICEDRAEKCLIAEVDAQPFGYVQWYLNQAFPDYGVYEAGFIYGVSFDYFIGESNFLGQSLGHKMLNATVNHAATRISDDDRRFFLIHDNENHTAIRCSKNAGFVWLDSIMHNGKQSGVYRRIH